MTHPVAIVFTALDEAPMAEASGAVVVFTLKGGALSPGAAGAVGGVDFGQVQAPPEDGLDVAAFACALADIVHEALHTRVAFEIQIHVLLRLTAADVELLRKAERRHAVHQAEIDAALGIGV